MTAARIDGPLHTWYDLHEALSHEARAVADLAAELTTDSLPAFAERFQLLADELRTHSTVEDGIMFPAVRAKGGPVADVLTHDHEREQTLVQHLSAAVLEARALGDTSVFATIADGTASLRDDLLPHLEAEEEHVLPLVPTLFDHDEQAHLLTLIITLAPTDPHLQAWVAGALTPEHRETRLRGMAAALPPAAMAGIMRQIEDGVTAEVWDDIVRRTPDLAALATGGPRATGAPTIGGPPN